jgi:hypothetical protein
MNAWDWICVCGVLVGVDTGGLLQKNDLATAIDILRVVV